MVNTDLTLAWIWQCWPKLLAGYRQNRIWFCVIRSGHVCTVHHPPQVSSMSNMLMCDWAGQLWQLESCPWPTLWPTARPNRVAHATQTLWAGQMHSWLYASCRNGAPVPGDPIGKGSLAIAGEPCCSAISRSSASWQPSSMSPAHVPAGSRT